MAEYRSLSGKDVKIIVFHTGNINITAAQTLEQVDEAYRFISDICTDYFPRLLLHTHYRHAELAHGRVGQIDRYCLGLINDQKYFLLLKDSIVADPRNVRILYENGKLPYYRSVPLSLAKNECL
jgi:hypothetical protein